MSDLTTSATQHAEVGDLKPVLRQAWLGDKAAFSKLYDWFHQSVLHAFFSMGASYEDSWDLMQETSHAEDRSFP